MTYKVTNYDCDGNIIEDLSKVVLSPEFNQKIIDVFIKDAEMKRRRKQNAIK